MSILKKTVLAATAAFVLGVGANAHALLIDGFANNAALISSGAVNGGNDTGANVNVTDTGLSNNVRFLYVERTSGTSTINDVTVGVADDIYQHSQGSNTAGFSQAKWTFDPTDFSGLGVIKAEWDADLIGAKIHMTLFDTSAGSQTLEFTMNSLVGTATFALAGFDTLDLENINMALMEVDGRQVGRLDVNIDIVNAEVPEPGTVLLFGTGLAGLGIWRWKKAQA